MGTARRDSGLILVKKKPTSTTKRRRIWDGMGWMVRVVADNQRTTRHERGGPSDRMGRVQMNYQSDFLRCRIFALVGGWMESIDRKRRRNEIRGRMQSNHRI